jgi:uncharacterized Zn-finger protein
VGNIITHKFKFHAAKKMIGCQFCDKKFQSHSLLATHLLHIHDHIVDSFKNNVRTCQCRICLMEFPNSNAVVDHQVAIHGYKCFECSECNKKCVSAGELRSHELVHSSEKSYSCNFCDKRFRYRTCLFLYVIF